RTSAKLPFDLPRARSEIMLGWQAEYPGVLFLEAWALGCEEEDPRIFCLPTHHDLRLRLGQVERESLHLRHASDQEDESAKSLGNDEPSSGLGSYNLSQVQGSCHHYHAKSREP